MPPEALSQPVARPVSVEPSRAWIVGLVVDADGSLRDAPPAEPDWPTPVHDADTPHARPDHITLQDVTVRP